VTHDGKISKIPCRRCDHNSDSFLLPRICPGRKLKFQARCAGVVVGRHAYGAPRLDPLNHLHQATRDAHAPG
jgi:hypothetical protein